MAVSCFDSNKVLFAALTLMAVGLLQANGSSDVRVVNNCSYPLTVFYNSFFNVTGLHRIDLAPGKNAQLGLPSTWKGGQIWASQHNNTNFKQATLLEFTFNIDVKILHKHLDFYDVSVINAYNEPASIKITSHPAHETGLAGFCGTDSCIIPDLSTVCKLKNYYAGPDHACINADGSKMVYTPSNTLFHEACPKVFAYELDDNWHIFDNNCTTGAQYDATWCP